VKKEETKTSKRQCPLSSVQVKTREGSREGIRVTMELGGTDEHHIITGSTVVDCSVIDFGAAAVTTHSTAIAPPTRSRDCLHVHT